MMAPPDVSIPSASTAYADHWEHLTDELRWLDLRIQQQVAILRAQAQGIERLAANRHVYISHEEVDWLLGGKEVVPEEVVSQSEALRCQAEQLRRQIQARVTASLAQGVFLPLVQLGHTFGLSPLEGQAVIVCLAPELQRKYDRLYAYLQDDITRKRPSIDLVLSLLCPTPADRWRARPYFSAHAPLLRAGILQTVDDPNSPSGSSDLAQFVRLDERILHYLLGQNQLDHRLVSLATVQRPASGLDQVLVEAGAKAHLLRALQRYVMPEAEERCQVVLYLHGPQGVGKRSLALGACAQLQCPLLSVDLELLLAREDAETLLRLALREGLLLQAAVYLDHLDVLLGEEPKAKTLLKALAKLITDYGWLVWLAGEKPWLPQGIFAHQVFQTIALPLPEVPLREAAWQQVFERHFPTAEASWVGQLANQFRLTPGQIRAAAALADGQCVRSNGQSVVRLTDLYAACRRQSQHKLGELAVKVEPQSGWQDLVLPEDTLTQLRDICQQARHRHRVFGEWGFDRKLSHGKGLSVLFSGPPGTGKTMAAEVIAHDLQVDLYKVDLSGVVSKYIGETEKNLSRIFQEAETSNALLFFDEADALFGKRTQVSDAHDRYANIETSYLLQKMEEYAGIVILATNLRENMDDAFTRRLRCIVEFPFPDEASRRLIWQTHFPPEAPLCKDIDYGFLAKKFQLAGGNIKNIVLNAAFYAAEDGGEIGMEHLLRGARREFEKIGKLWNESPSTPFP